MARFQSGTEICDVVRDDDDRRAFCDRQRELLATGWRRVHDPLREQAFPDDARAPTLEQAIRENYDDDQNWLVYADHLIEHGHPRGALVALAAAPVTNIVQRAAREAEAHRLRNASELLGRGLVGRAGLSVRWRRGVIHSAKLHGAFARGDAEDLLFDLLRHPCARFLRELEITCWHHDAQDHRLLVELLVHADPRPPLRKLAIEYPTTTWAGYPPLGDIGALAAAYPQLADFRIEGDNTTRFAGLALPRATRFGFETIAMPPHALRAIAAARWPVLEELALWLHESTCTVDELRFALALPALRRLRLLGAACTNELVVAIAASPIAPQLELLDLRHGPFDERGAAALLAARACFQEDITVRIDTARLSEDVRDQLRDANLDVDW
jgi:uncharacterized protein (TIGR02996 family)